MEIWPVLPECILGWSESFLDWKRNLSFHKILNLSSSEGLNMHMISRITYQARLDKRFMNFVTLQPLVIEQAFIPYMKAKYAPLHLLYGSLICYQRLQSDRPKWRGIVAEVSQTPKHIYKIPISWTIGQILISVDSPKCPLSDEVWLLAQLQERAKWLPERLGHSLFHINSGLFCLLFCTVRSGWPLPAFLFILVCHSVTP